MKRMVVASALLAVGLWLAPAVSMAQDKDRDRDRSGARDRDRDRDRDRGDRDRSGARDRDRGDRGDRGRDQEFVTKAVEAGLAEVSAGMLALQLQQGASGPVRTFADRIVRDHRMANQQLLDIASRERYRVPRQADKKHRDLLDKMAGIRGARFDRDFARHMVDDHKEAVKLFADESKNGKDNRLKDFASKTLPTLREHLKMAERLAGTDRDRGGDRDRGRDRDRNRSDRDRRDRGSR